MRTSSKYDFSIYEILMAVMTLVYIINCIFGKNTNDKYANKWLQHSLPFLESNYAHVGINTEYTTNSSNLLL